MDKIRGNTEGIRRSYLEQLESIYEIEAERDVFCNREIIEALAKFTEATGREVMLYLDRTGRVITIGIGEQDRVLLPSHRKRRSKDRLSGLRCIHTHPGGNSALSDVDIQSLKNIRLDAMAAVGVLEGRPVSMQVGVLEAVPGEKELSVNLFGPYKINAIPDDFLFDEIYLADTKITAPDKRKPETEIMRAILVGIGNKENEQLDELKLLADTAGFITAGQLMQSRQTPDKGYYLGYGKLHDLVLEINRLSADAIIFDDELTPAQIRNISKELGKIEVIDRTALILDIFSSRASTHEGRLQVELAQTKYLLPRMAGYWTHMSRMAGGGRGGGGARRGEGETQLEVDRRILRRRLDELEKEIDKIKSGRAIQRVARERSKVPVIALVGYTNAGKSTLMNCLSGSSVLAEDKLFATLDPVSRRVNYGDGDFLLVDTVGFINKLPHDLVNAFRATLEETKHADLILHVVDASSENRFKQAEVVLEVLNQIEAGNKPMLTVHNKCDVSAEIPYDLNAVNISALTGMGMDSLKAAITEKLSQRRTELSVLLPLDSGALISRIYESGQVIDCKYKEEGVYISAVVNHDDASRLRLAAIEVL